MCFGKGRRRHWESFVQGNSVRKEPGCHSRVSIPISLPEANLPVLSKPLVEKCRIPGSKETHLLGEGEGLPGDVNRS